MRRFLRITILLAAILGTTLVGGACSDDQTDAAVSSEEAFEELAAAFEELMSRGPVLIRRGVESPSDERRDTSDTVTIDRAAGRYLFESTGEVNGTTIIQIRLHTDDGDTYLLVPEDRRAQSENHAWVLYRQEVMSAPAEVIGTAERLRSMGGRIVEREVDELDGASAVRFRMVVDNTVSTDGAGGRSERFGSDSVFWVVDGVVAREETKTVAEASSRVDESVLVSTYATIPSLVLPAPLEDHIEVSDFDEANRIAFGMDPVERSPAADLEYEPVP